MTTITFPRPTPALLSMNDRHHWRRRASDVKAWRLVAGLYASAVRRDLIIGTLAKDSTQTPALVCVTLDVPDRRRRDPANYFATVKVCVDACVDAGWWPDDTPEWVTVCEPVLRVVKGPLMVTVELVPR